MKIFLYTITLLTALISVSASAGTPTRFAPYADITINSHWDPHYQDMEPMDLNSISKASGIKHYNLAFITDAGNCNPAWGAESSYATSTRWGSHLTDALRASNVDYTIALGGANGNDISKACTNTDLLKAYEQIITLYQPTGLDFDIENGSADIPKIMATLVNIQRNHPQLTIRFTLPTLPDGLTPAGENIVKQAEKSGLTFSVNIMAMDYGPVFTNDMGEYAIQAATKLFSFLKILYPTKPDADIWQTITVTPMIGVNDTNVEQFTLSDVDTLRHFAEKNMLGGLSMWSIARDNPCRDIWASPICSGNNLQTRSYEFVERFLANNIKVSP